MQGNKSSSMVKWSTTNWFFVWRKLMISPRPSNQLKLHCSNIWRWAHQSVDGWILNFLYLFQTQAKSHDMVGQTVGWRSGPDQTAIGRHTISKTATGNLICWRFGQWFGQILVGNDWTVRSAEGQWVDQGNDQRPNRWWSTPLGRSTEGMPLNQRSNLSMHHNLYLDTTHGLAVATQQIPIPPKRTSLNPLPNFGSIMTQSAERKRQQSTKRLKARCVAGAPWI